jgi:hypothetical protein
MPVADEEPLAQLPRHHLHGVPEKYGAVIDAGGDRWRELAVSRRQRIRLS